MEVATTSQMLLANTIFESFLAKHSIWLCTGFSVAQNGHFCDEVQAPSDFLYTTSFRCWHTCAPVWTNFGWLYRQGERLNFNHMLCCCHRGVPTKTFVS